jgi:hypothetical protein
MGSGFDNSIYWIISHVVTIFHYYTFKITVIITHKAFNSHVKSSQVFYKLLVAFSYRELHSLLLFCTSLSVFLDQSSRGDNMGTITVALNDTLQILHINKIFKSHFKSSQADLLYSSVVLVPIHSVCMLPPRLSILAQEFCSLM